MIIGVAVALLLLPVAGDEREEPAEEEAWATVGKREHQDALKACAAAALQRHRSLASARIQVTLTIEGGAVSAVSVSAPKELAAVAACLERRVRHWTFPVSDETYSVDVPMILQGSSAR